MKIGKAENSNLKLVYNDIPNSFLVFIPCKIPLSHHIQVMKFIWAWNMNLTYEQKKSLQFILFIFFFESAKRENCRCIIKWECIKNGYFDMKHCFCHPMSFWDMFLTTWSLFANSNCLKRQLFDKHFVAPNDQFNCNEIFFYRDSGSISELAIYQIYVCVCIYK